MARAKLVPTNAGLGDLSQDPPSFQAALKSNIVANVGWSNDGGANRPKIEKPLMTEQFSLGTLSLVSWCTESDVHTIWHISRWMDRQPSFYIPITF